MEATDLSLQQASVELTSLLSTLANSRAGAQVEYLVRLLYKLNELPPSGGGGCHAALLGAANLAVRAGLKGKEFIQLSRYFIDDDTIGHPLC